MVFHMVLVYLLFKFGITHVIRFETEPSPDTYTLLEKDHGYSTNGKSFLSFRVKTCGNVYVGFLLTEERTFKQKEMTYVVYTPNSHQIVIDNKASPTKYGILLDCKNFTVITIHWNVTGITTFMLDDEERSVLSEFYIAADSPTLSKFTYIGLLTYAEAEWIIENDRTPRDTIDTTSATNTACNCVCHNTTPVVISTCTSADVNCLVKELKVELTVDKSILSSSIRKKISIGDRRPSAQALGAIGAIIIVVSISLIVVPDAVKLAKYLYQGKDVTDLAKKQKKTRRTSNNR